MSNLYKDAPIVKVVMLKGKDGAKSALSELTNDMTFLTREQIITLVTNIINSGSVGDIDTGFVTKIVEQNKKKAMQFWIGTQAEYSAIPIKDVNMYYIITDDTTKADIEAELENLREEVENLDFETEIAAINQTIQSQAGEITDIQADIGDVQADIGDIQANFYPSRPNAPYNTNISTTAFLSADAKTINFPVPLVRLIDINKQNVTLTEFKYRVVQNGAYIVGDATTQVDGTNITSIYRTDTSAIHVSVDRPTAYTGATGNDVVGVSATLRFTVTDK